MLPEQLHIVRAFRVLGLYVELDMTRDEALTLTADDVDALTELGATPEMFNALDTLACASEAGCTLVMEFEAATVFRR